MKRSAKGASAWQYRYMFPLFSPLVLAALLAEGEMIITAFNRGQRIREYRDNPFCVLPLSGCCEHLVPSGVIEIGHLRQQSKTWVMWGMPLICSLSTWEQSRLSQPHETSSGRPASGLFATHLWACGHAGGWEIATTEASRTCFIGILLSSHCIYMYARYLVSIGFIFLRHYFYADHFMPSFQFYSYTENHSSTKVLIGHWYHEVT